MFCFTETEKTRYAFSEIRFLYLDESKKQTWLPLVTQTGRFMKKNVLKRQEVWLRPGDST